MKGYIKSDPVLEKARNEIYESLWRADEVMIHIAEDKEHLKNLPEKQQELIHNILSFFRIGDEYLIDEIKKIEIAEPSFNNYNIFKEMIENIHSETYAQQYDILFPDREILSIPLTRIVFCKKYLKTDNIARKMFILAILEGLQFKPNFAYIYWYKLFNIFPSLRMANELICRDEENHWTIDIYLMQKLGGIPELEAIEIMKEAVEIENQISIAITPIGPNMNPNLMHTYIKFIADTIMNEAGFNKIYNVENPFNFMESYGIRRNFDFFRITSTDYQSYKKEKFELKLFPIT
jgi:ribonucleoside-diphosphate reductase beta chain